MILIFCILLLVNHIYTRTFQSKCKCNESGYDNETIRQKYYAFFTSRHINKTSTVIPLNQDVVRITSAEDLGRMRPPDPIPIECCPTDWSTRTPVVVTDDDNISYNVVHYENSSQIIHEGRCREENSICANSGRCETDFNHYTYVLVFDSNVEEGVRFLRVRIPRDCRCLNVGVPLAPGADLPTSSLGPLNLESNQINEKKQEVSGKAYK